MLSLRSVWCHVNHVNAHASNAIIVITFDRSPSSFDRLLHSIIQVRFRYRKTVLNGRLFDSPCWPGIYMFTQESESRPWCQLGAGQVIAKIRVRAKSQKRFKLSLSRFHYSAWFLYFIRFQACYVACHPKASISFKLQWLFKLKKNWKAQLLGGKIGLDETLSPGFFPEVMRGTVDKGKAQRTSLD